MATAFGYNARIDPVGSMRCACAGDTLNRRPWDAYGMAVRWRHGWWLLMVPLALNAATGIWLMTRPGEALDGAQLTGFCLLAGALVWQVRQTGSWLLWLIPLNFAGVTAVMATSDAGLMGYYGGVTVMCALGAFLGTGSQQAAAAASGKTPA